MAQPLQPGDPARLGAYVLVGRLGEGGQGMVYLARRPTSGGATMTDSRGSTRTGSSPVSLNPTGREAAEYCAVKLLRPEIAGDGMARARFLREAEAARRVAQFCTAQVLEAGVDGDRLFMVTEYVPGPSLKQMVEEQGPRRGGELDRLAIGTATALVAIHQAGIVHRDFKPHNVLMGPDGPRVIDFGIARTGDAALTSTGASIGTPAYMAPEQVRGQPSGPATDLFAWGGTMLFAATGAAPFGTGSIGTVAHRIVTGTPDLSALREPLRRQVAACMDPDPRRRPAANQVLLGLLGTAGGPAVESTQILSEGAFAANAAQTMTAGPRGGGTPPMGTVAPASDVAPEGESRGRRKALLIGLAAALCAVIAAVVVIALASSNTGNPGTNGVPVSPTVTPTTTTPSHSATTSQAPTQTYQPTYSRPTTTAPTTATTAPTTTPPTTATTTAPTTNPPT